MGKHGASPLRRVCTPRSRIAPPILRSAPMLLQLQQQQQQHRYRQSLNTPSLVAYRMGYDAPNSPVQGYGGGAPRPQPRRVPYSVWRPEFGIVFGAAPTPGSGPPSSSTYQPTDRTYSAQQPIVFGQSLSFDQAPSFGQVPTFGRAPSFGQARSSEGTPSLKQARSFDSTSSCKRTALFEKAATSEQPPPSSQDAPVSGQTPSSAPRLPSSTPQPAFGRAPSEQQSFRQSSFGRPIQSIWPVFVFSNQSRSRFIHSSSARTSSPHEAQALESKEIGKSVIGQAESKEEAADATEAVEEPVQKAAETKVLPPETDLDFKMSKTLFEKARNAAPGTPESYWSYTLYRNKAARDKIKNTETVSDAESDTSDAHSVRSAVTNSAEKAGNGASNGARAEHERVKVHYCRSMETTERVCAQYFADEPLLGFDLEWMADAAKWQGPRKNVCLLQLASPSRIGLFHLSLFPTRDLMPPTLRKILESPDITKVGVFIKGDATRLRNHLAVNMQGLIELSHLHRLVKYSKTGEHHLITRRLVSLAAQVEENLKLPLFKGQDVRSGNWYRPLRMDQISYSASDAYASVQIYAVLEKERLSLDPTPPRPAFAELNMPIKLASGAVLTTADESAADDAEEALQGGDETTDAAAPLLSEIIADAEHTVSAEGETVGASSQVKKSPALTKRKSISAGNSDKTTKTAKAAAIPKAFTDARLVASHQWMDQYRQSKAGSVKATAACLRAYHLWYANADLDAEKIAALLRDPPIQTATVVGYILSAVQLEKLPYDKERCRAELMELLPHKTRLSRYRRLAKACGYDLTAPDPALARN